MISMVCAVHDQLSHNQVFWETLVKYTFHPFELIVVDNRSTDGSGDFYRRMGATVLPQERNCPYPEAMNIGTLHARGKYICHINNDVIVGVHWDKALVEALEELSLDVVIPACLEFMPTLRETRKGLRRWRRIGSGHHRASREELLSAWMWMYGDWERFCAEHARRNRGRIADGIIGHTVMMKRSAWEKVGPFDERVIGTDWELYLTAKKREQTIGDIRAPKIVLWSYVHHFGQATARGTKDAYEGMQPLCWDLREKWSGEEIEKYWPYPAQIHPKPKFLEHPLRFLRCHFKRAFDLYEREEDW